jgi:hypothetical protein
MRTNWVKNLLGIFLIAGIIFLAWLNPFKFTARGASLGEPDPLLFLFMAAVYGFTSWWAFIFGQRNSTIVGITQHNRVSLHNVDEFLRTQPPAEYSDAMKAAWELMDSVERPEYPEMVTGNYSCYVGEGYQSLRARGSGESVVIIEPSELVTKYSDCVDFLGDDKCYSGFEHTNLPKWVLAFCIQRVPGFVLFGTDVIYADRPGKYAVRAWDADQQRPVFCRFISGTDIDYEGRLSYLEKISTKMENRVNSRRTVVMDEYRKRMRKKQQQPAQPQPQQPAQANTGGRQNV